MQDLQEWLKQHSFALNREGQLIYQRPQAGAPWAELKREWELVEQVQNGGGEQPRFPQLAGFFVFHAAADQRLALLGQSAPYDPLTEAPTDPLQVLFARPDLEERLRKASEEAFGVGLVLSKIWGTPLRLHIGECDLEPSLPPSQEYIDQIQALPLASDQGDGIRSFIGLMLAINASGFPVLLIDEPEAFLHPPQARLLGRKLVADTADQTQVFVATHDRDILQGVLEVPSREVTVIRLVRQGDQNLAAVLSPDRMREIWADPLLRYSNVLEGLFHKGVVVSEADSDSRFYSAVLDASREAEQLAPHDLLFTQAGGKQRIPTVVRALASLSIPVAVTSDFDLLREDQPLQEIVELMNGSWTDIETDLRMLRSGVEDLGAAPPIEAVRADLNEILDEADGPRLARQESQRIRAATRLSDGWQQAKRGGLAVLPQGDTATAGTRLLATLKRWSIFIVPVGELERWEPDIENHGPRWVSSVLQNRRHEAPTQGADAFIAEVAHALET
ncbi:MAG TPA: AAA family ATPase [Solirubrobacterales bacterium]|nr:AAA family ATPase [Solirubrobacterales bacterium]